MSIQSRVGWVFQPLSVNVGSIARWMLVNTTDLFFERMGTEKLVLPLVALFCMRIQKAGWPERELGECFFSLPGRGTFS